MASHSLFQQFPGIICLPTVEMLPNSNIRQGHHAEFAGVGELLAAPNVSQIGGFWGMKSRSIRLAVP